MSKFMGDTGVERHPMTQRTLQYSRRCRRKAKDGEKLSNSVIGHSKVRAIAAMYRIMLGR